MSLVKFTQSLRRAASLAGATMILACGGGGGGGGGVNCATTPTDPSCPQPKPVASAAVPQISGNFTDGDSIPVQFSASTTKQMLDSLGLDGYIVRGPAQTLQGTKNVELQAGPNTFTATPYQTGADITAASTTVNAAAINGGLRFDKASYNVGDQIRLTATGNGDSLKVTIPGMTLNPVKGDSTDYVFTATTPGTLPATLTIVNGRKNATKAPVSTTIVQPVVTYNTELATIDPKYGTQDVQIKIDGVAKAANQTHALTAGVHKFELVPNQSNVIDFYAIIRQNGDTAAVLDLNTLAADLNITANEKWSARAYSRQHPELSPANQACISEVYFTKGAVVGIPGLALPRNSQGIRTINLYLQRSALTDSAFGLNAVAVSDANANLWTQAAAYARSQNHGPLNISVVNSTDVIADATTTHPVLGKVIAIGKGIIHEQTIRPPSGGPTLDSSGHITGYNAQINQNFSSLAARVSELDFLHYHASKDATIPNCDTQNNNYGRLPGPGSLDIFTKANFHGFADWKSDNALKNLRPFPQP